MSALQGKNLQHQVCPFYLSAILAVCAILQHRLASLLWSARLVLTFHEDTCFKWCTCGEPVAAMLSKDCLQSSYVLLGKLRAYIVCKKYRFTFAWLCMPPVLSCIGAPQWCMHVILCNMLQDLDKHRHTDNTYNHYKMTMTRLAQLQVYVATVKV